MHRKHVTAFYTPRIQHRDDRFGGRKHAVTPCTWHDFVKFMLCNEAMTHQGRGQALAIFGNTLGCHPTSLAARASTTIKHGD